MSATVYQRNTNTPTASCLIVWDLLLFAVGVEVFQYVLTVLWMQRWAEMLFFNSGRKRITKYTFGTEKTIGKVSEGKERHFSICCVNK